MSLLKMINQIIRAWRWDLISIACATLGFGWITASTSAYFLQIDTTTQNVVALAWSHNCWVHGTEKMLPVVLLAPLFNLFGPSPHWETLLLLIGAAITSALVYEFSRLLTYSKTAGLWGALLVTALPASQYFSRTYLGYVAPCLLLGWLAIWRDRWAWAGLCFGLAITAHFNSLVPIGLSCVALGFFYLRPATWKNWLAFGLAAIFPLAAVEMLYFFYMGHVYLFIWSRDIITVTLRHANSAVAAPHPNWLWVAQTIVDSNGPLMSMVLASGIFAPIVLRHNKTGLALSLSFLCLIPVYTLQAGIGRSWVVPRLLASAYPVWAICSAVVLQWIIERLPSLSLRRLSAGLMILGLTAVSAQTSLFIYKYSQTLYPQVEQWLVRAKTENRPVRSQGIPWITLFYAQAYGIELLANDYRWIDANAPGQAVLIFADRAPDNLSRNNYTVTVITNDSSTDTLYPALTYEGALPRRFELWWPRQDSASVKPATPPDDRVVGLYYSGSGCLTPPVYNDGARPRALHFYQLVWKKITGTYGR